MSYLELAKQAEARLRAARETPPGYAIDAIDAESARQQTLDPGPAAAATPAFKPEALSAAPVPEPVPALPALDPATVREALGDKPDPHAVAMIAWDVLSAVRALEREIQSGVMAPGPRRVAGRPLGDWLDLDDVARLLRAWSDRRDAR